MSKYCFWILTDGTIVKPDRRHILAVASAPRAFGETVESLQETFESYGQGIHSNFEGEAREIVLTRIIKRNHIRIRKNQHKNRQNWSIQLFILTDERKKDLSEWASYISSGTKDKYADVIIHQLNNNSKLRTSLDLLAEGFVGEREPVIVSQSELVRRYA
jgi:hypothetical protein